MSFGSIPIHKIKKTWFRKYGFTGNMYSRDKDTNYYCNDYRDLNWIGCCVCKKVTISNIPWYKRVIFIILKGTSEEMTEQMRALNYKCIHCWKKSEYSTDSIWYTIYGVCSKECLTLFILNSL